MNTRSLTLVPALLALVSPYALGQNDECVNATVVAPGAYAYSTGGASLSAEPWACANGGGPDLWYAYTAQSTDTIVLALCGTSYDTALEVFTGSCGALSPFLCDDDSCGFQSFVTFVGVPGTTYLFRVGGYFGSTGQGTLTVAVGPPLGAEDECAGAITLFDGATPFSTFNATTSAPAWPCAFGGSDIWYSITAVGTQLAVDTLGSGYDTTLQAFDGVCGALTSLVCNDDAVQGTLQSALSITTVPGQTYLVRVGGYASDQGIGVIRVVGAGPPNGGVIGASECAPAVTNSTGRPGVLTARGSAVAAADDVTLEATDLPASAFGYFLVSRTPGAVQSPGGSQGVLCLGGAIGRYVGPGQVLNSGSAGTFSLALDLTATPTPTGFVAIQAGETWRFQAWHRDALGGVATSNFTHGVVIDFH